MTPKTINVAVAEKVAGLGSAKVVETVVDKLVTAEITKRAEALAAAIKLAEDTLRESRKAAKPDVITVNAAGEKSEAFSPKAFEAKKKLDEKLAKIDKIVEAALTDGGDWGKLYELVKNGGNQAAATTDELAANS
jgi:hypothetical protein